MNLRTRIEKLENIQRADEIYIEGRGKRFFLHGRELTTEQLKRLSTKYNKIVITNYLHDKVAEILESLDCDVEINGKYYVVSSRINSIGYNIGVPEWD